MGFGRRPVLDRAVLTGAKFSSWQAGQLRKDLRHQGPPYIIIILFELFLLYGWPYLFLVMFFVF